MKRILKTYFKFFIFTFILTIISCKEDVLENNLEETSIEEHIISTKHLTIDDLPDLEAVIIGVSVNRTSKTASTTFGDLNLSDIIEYVNEDGKETYTFKIENSENVEDPIEFENLHLINLPDDEGYLAYILKWEPDLEWYAENNYQFNLYDFTGKQTHYDLNYSLIKETEFINGQVVEISGKSSTVNNYLQKEWYYVIDIYSLCTDSPSSNCGGSICGFGVFNIRWRWRFRKWCYYGNWDIFRRRTFIWQWWGLKFWDESCGKWRRSSSCKSSNTSRDIV